jgi:hypothetical protein
VWDFCFSCYWLWTQLPSLLWWLQYSRDLSPFQRNIPPLSSTLELKPQCSSVKLLNICHSKQCHISGDSILHCKWIVYVPEWDSILHCKSIVYVTEWDSIRHCKWFKSHFFHLLNWRRFKWLLVFSCNCLGFWGEVSMGACGHLPHIVNLFACEI